LRIMKWLVLLVGVVGYVRLLRLKVIQKKHTNKVDDPTKKEVDNPTKKEVDNLTKKEVDNPTKKEVDNSIENGNILH